MDMTDCGLLKFAGKQFANLLQGGDSFESPFYVRPARTYSNGCKSPNRPDGGKVTAEGKGVHREMESE